MRGTITTVRFGQHRDDGPVRRRRAGRHDREGHGHALEREPLLTAFANANTAINRIDSALTVVSNLRSTFGAIQNRFESTIASLSAVSENLEASRSRILDADFAAETAALTRAQILQQAGVAILAQANTAPQSVLALLQ